jgi:P4 family phage/plasmid primase-like protien
MSKRIRSNSLTDELTNIKSAEDLELAIKNIMDNLTSAEYKLKEIHQYTQILPEKYYKSGGSHGFNTNVGIALKNTDKRLFLSWIMLRSKAVDFSYEDIPRQYNRWLKFKSDDKAEKLTFRSIYYWAKTDAKEEFDKIKKTTLEYFIGLTIGSDTDYDFAMVLYNLHKDKFICSSVQAKTWYRFENHRWVKDSGSKIRLSISRDMYDLYDDYRTNLQFQLNTIDPTDELYDKIKKRLHLTTETMQKLKKTSDKNNILRESIDIFYDEDFINKMDANPYLICFANGVVDIKNKKFRDGLPCDYITKSTNIDYAGDLSQPDINLEFADIKEEITSFMNKLFPIKELNTYMWQHLASVLIGQNINQSFNIYIGNGCNGKSLLTDLMSMTFGEYAGIIPINLITDARVKIGSTSSELIKLKGVRYAVMSEPSKGMRVNEGFLKQLTGDTKMTAREIYQESENFTIQFSPIACTNTDLDFNNATDDGTWRRIRKVHFMAKFVDVKEGEELQKYHFPKDITLKEKLPIWAPVFASMLVGIVFETQGHIEECEIVMQETNKYRHSQDHIASFVSEKITLDAYGTISQPEVNIEFKNWFGNREGSLKNVPKGVELHSYINKTFNMPFKGGKWYGIKINSIIEEEEEYNTNNNVKMLENHE